MVIHTAPVPAALSLPASRLDTIKKELRRLTAAAVQQRLVPVRSVARLTGLVAAACVAFVPGRALLCHLNRWVASVSRSAAGWRAAALLGSLQLAELCELKAAFADHRWRLRLPLPPSTPTATVTTDASEWGWGCVALLPPQQLSTNDTASSRRASERVELQDRWFRSSISTEHSNLRECRALLFSLRALRERLRNQSVLVRSDNRVVVALVARLASSSPAINQFALQLLNLASQYNIRFCRPQHVPGVNNTEADGLSRGWSPARRAVEWSMHPRAVRAVCQLFDFGVPSVDRFASRSNAVVPRFNAFQYDPEAEAFDGLAQPWSNERNWVNPPFRLLPMVVRKLYEEPADAIVIAPDWPSAPWFASLSALACRSLPLPSSAVVPHGKCSRTPEPLRNSAWGLRAFLVRRHLHC